MEEGRICACGCGLELPPPRRPRDRRVRFIRGHSARRGYSGVRVADEYLLPIYRRDGTPRAWAVIDPDTYEKVRRWRWGLSGKGYVARQVRLPGGPRRSIYLARIVLGLEPGDPRQADHISGDKLDNRRANLRIVTFAQNMENRRDAGSSGHRNVSWQASTRRWRVRFGQEQIGTFDDLADAVAAAESYRRAHRPFAPA